MKKFGQAVRQADGSIAIVPTESPWDHQPLMENDYQYRLFLQYLHFSFPRPFDIWDQLARKFGMPKKSIKNMAHAYHWESRATAYDQKRIEHVREHADKSVQEFAANFLEVANALARDARRLSLASTPAELEELGIAIQKVPVMEKMIKQLVGVHKAIFGDKVQIRQETVLIDQVQFDVHGKLPDDKHLLDENDILRHDKVDALPPASAGDAGDIEFGDGLPGADQVCEDSTEGGDTSSTLEAGVDPGEVRGDTPKVDSPPVGL